MEDVELDSLIEKQQKENKQNNRKNSFGGRDRRGGGRRDNYNNNNRRNFRNNNYNNNRRNYNNNRQEQLYRLKIENLHYAVGEDDLRQEFSKFGEIKRCKINWDDSGRSEESGFIDFFEEDDAQRAADEFNNQKFEGQIINAYVTQAPTHQNIRRTGGFKKRQGGGGDRRRRY